jgi:hypothetical protein
MRNEIMRLKERRPPPTEREMEDHQGRNRNLPPRLQNRLGPPPTERNGGPPRQKEEFATSPSKPTRATTDTERKGGPPRQKEEFATSPSKPTQATTDREGNGRSQIVARRTLVRTPLPLLPQMALFRATSQMA